MVQQTSNIQPLSKLLAAFALALLPTITCAAAPADRLPTLVSETSTQFQLAYRLHPAEQQHRQEQLTAVVAAWRTAPRNDKNNERLSAWLRSAIRASMPGSRENLPPMPTFMTGGDIGTRAAEPRPAETPASEPTPASPVVAPTPAANWPVTPDQKLEADPFRDDPTDDQE